MAAGLLRRAPILYGKPTVPRKTAAHHAEAINAATGDGLIASPIEPLAMAAIADQLNRVGYIVLARPLLEKLSTRLAARCFDGGPSPFHAAQIGRGSGHNRDDAIRGDVTRWLDGNDIADGAYLVWMEDLRVGLNAALYLGLFEYEGHYAIYGAGAGYAKHSDVLSGKRNRLLSTVLYLNDDWQPDDGGELILYDASGETVIATVNPTFGRMIIFLSDSFPHEVLRAQTRRCSIAGWFRGREA